MSLYVRSYNLSNLHDGEIVVYNGDTAGSYFTKGAGIMVSSKELGALLRLLANVPVADKPQALNYLRSLQDSGDSLAPLVSSQAKAEE